MKLGGGVSSVKLLTDRLIGISASSKLTLFVGRIVCLLLLVQLVLAVLVCSDNLATDKHSVSLQVS